MDTPVIGVAARTDSLAHTTKQLMFSEPFYGIFLSTLTKRWMKNIKTAAVTLVNLNYQLWINPEFWDGLNEDQRKGLLKHELMHITLFHLTDFKHLQDQTLMNIAADLEINQYIKAEELPDKALKLDTFKEENLEPFKGTLYYYDKLKKSKNPATKQKLDAINQGIGNGEFTITLPDGTEVVFTDDHSKWNVKNDQYGDAADHIINTHYSGIIKDIAEQVIKSCGNVPGNIQGLLDRLQNPEKPKFDWKRYIRQFVVGNGNTYTKLSKRKPSMRFEDARGIKIKKNSHLLIAIDTSGSVSNDELKEFFNEIDHIMKLNVRVTVAQCDTAIHSKEEYKKGQELKITGRGGTSFDPIIDYYDENRAKYSTLIYLTDGEAPAPRNPRGKMLWVMSSRSQINTSLPGPQIKLN